MLFILTVLLAIGGAILYFIVKNNYKISSLWDSVSMTVSVVCTCISFVMIIFILSAQIGVAGRICSMQEEYKGLIYKAKTESSRDELGILNKDFIDEVQAWNMNIASGQEWQHDFWVGIFVPPVYDGFELIDLESITFKSDAQ